jgi:hypothetical protein
MYYLEVDLNFNKEPAAATTTTLNASITELVTDFAPVTNQGPGVPPLPLTAAEVQWNSGKNGSRIEHAVSEQQRPFGMYQTKFRGDPCIPRGMPDHHRPHQSAYAPDITQSSSTTSEDPTPGSGFHSLTH